MNGFDLLALLFLSVTAMTGASIITMFAYSRVLGRKRNELPNYKKRKDTHNVDPSLAHGHHEPHVWGTATLLKVNLIPYLLVLLPPLSPELTPE